MPYRSHWRRSCVSAARGEVPAAKGWPRAHGLAARAPVAWVAPAATAIRGRLLGVRRRDVERRREADLRGSGGRRARPHSADSAPRHALRCAACHWSTASALVHGPPAAASGSVAVPFARWCPQEDQQGQDANARGGTCTHCGALDRATRLNLVLNRFCAGAVCSEPEGYRHRSPPASRSEPSSPDGATDWPGPATEARQSVARTSRYGSHLVPARRKPRPALSTPQPRRHASCRGAPDPCLRRAAPADALARQRTPAWHSHCYLPLRSGNRVRPFTAAFGLAYASDKITENGPPTDEADEQ